jgi:hypothetical protein
LTYLGGKDREPGLSTPHHYYHIHYGAVPGAESLLWDIGLGVLFLGWLGHPFPHQQLLLFLRLVQGAPCCWVGCGGNRGLP